MTLYKSLFQGQLHEAFQREGLDHLVTIDIAGRVAWLPEGSERPADQEGFPFRVKLANGMELYPEVRDEAHLATTLRAWREGQEAFEARYQAILRRGEKPLPETPGDMVRVRQEGGRWIGEVMYRDHPPRYLFSTGRKKDVAARLANSPIPWTGHCWCLDCGRHPEPFMLLPEIWALLNTPLGDGHLCWGCAERRLGRPIELRDLTDVSLNQNIFRGAFLGAQAALKGMTS